jgi:hypothetical protein
MVHKTYPNVHMVDPNRLSFGPCILHTSHATIFSQMLYVHGSVHRQQQQRGYLDHDHGDHNDHHCQGLYEADALDLVGSNESVFSLQRDGDCLHAHYGDHNDHHCQGLYEADAVVSTNQRHRCYRNPNLPY